MESIAQLDHLKYLLGFGISFVISVGLTPLIFLIARRHGLARRPVSDRWHTTAIPSMGGIAIFLGWVIPMYFDTMPSLQRSGLMVAGTCALILGLCDDIKPLGALSKLGGQICVALILLYFNVRVEIIENVYVAGCVTVIWVVVVMNAINIIDNMDGACAGTALIIAVNLCVLGFLYPSYAISSICILLAGSLAGFLVWNFPPAKIFMGDTGSMFVGFLLAALALMGSWRDVSHLWVMLSIPLLLFTLPLFDVVLVFIIRKINGRPVYRGGRDHTSHRLVLMGLSERQTICILWGVSLVSGALMFSVTTGPLVVKISVGAVLLLFLLAAGLFLGRLDTYNIEKELEASDCSLGTTVIKQRTPIEKEENDASSKPS